jgi:uncharacterized protein DUF6788
MQRKRSKRPDRRAELIAEIERLAATAIFGTVSETYRTCGTSGCHCRSGGPKHGPHLYVSYRGDAGKTTGYYVPKAAHTEIRNGVLAWQTLQLRLRELAALTKDQVLARTKEEGER